MFTFSSGVSWAQTCSSRLGNSSAGRGCPPRAAFRRGAATPSARQRRSELDLLCGQTLFGRRRNHQAGHDESRRTPRSRGIPAPAASIWISIVEPKVFSIAHDVLPVEFSSENARLKPDMGRCFNCHAALPECEPGRPSPLHTEKRNSTQGELPSPDRIQPSTSFEDWQCCAGCEAADKRLCGTTGRGDSSPLRRSTDETDCDSDRRRRHAGAERHNLRSRDPGECAADRDLWDHQGIFGDAEPAGPAPAPEPVVHHHPRA